MARVAPRRHSLDWLRILVPVSSLLVLGLSVGTLHTRAYVNLFSLDLTRLWTVGQLKLSQETCEASTDLVGLRRMDRYLTNVPNGDRRKHFRLGLLACLAGSRNSAIKEWLSEPNFIPSALFAAVVAFSHGRVIETPHNEALGTYGRLVGHSREAAKDLSAAERWYSFSTSYWPNSETVESLSKLLDLQGKHVPAELAWQRLLEVASPRTRDHWEALAQIAEHEQRWRAAARAYRQAASVESSRGSYFLWIKSGRAALHAKLYRDACVAFQQALAMDSADLSAYLWMGHTFRYEGRLEDSNRWYQRAQAIAPHHYAPPLYQAVIMITLGRYGEALTSLDHSLKLRPGNPSALYQKAKALKALGRRGEAVKAMRRAVSLSAVPPQGWTAELRVWEDEAP